MVFHGDYEEALDDRESRFSGSANEGCPSNLKVGDLVRSKSKWFEGCVGIITDVYKITHEISGEFFWCCRVYIDNQERTLPIRDFELVERR